MYTEKKFELSNLKGLSEKQISEHLKLYAGYVKNTNSLLEKISKLRNEENGDPYVLAELKRRLGFEWNGMRLHEFYFEEFGGDGVISGGELKNALSDEFGNYESWLSDIKNTALQRGIGWALLCKDTETGKLFNTWIGDHDIGHLAETKILLALDIWEHAFLLDYIPAQRKEYIEAFFSNLKWSIIEKRFSK